MTILKNNEYFLAKYLLASSLLILFSCSNTSSNKEMDISEEISFSYNLDFNDTDIIDSDSLYYELEFDMTGIKSVNMSISIDSIAYESFEISSIDSSIELLERHIPITNQNKSIDVSFISNNEILGKEKHALPQIRDMEVITFSENDQKNTLFANNRFINNKNVIYDKFKKYDFGNTEIIILNDLDSLSDKMIVELQNFLLNNGFIVVLMNQNIKDNNNLSYSLGYPKVKAIRGASSNQFFSILDEGFLQKHSFFSKDLASESQVYRYFELTNNDKDFSKIMISTNDPLLIAKDVLGGKIFFLTTKIDPNWSNKSFDLLFNDILDSIFFQRLSYNES